MKKVSIIVPVYNTQVDLLEKCMETILKQTYSNLEIIVIDDGSKKEVSSLCDMFEVKDLRVIVIHKKNEGVSIARNTGLDKATGEWVTFVDSDDWIELDAIEKMVESIEGYDLLIARDFIDNEKQITSNDDTKIVSNDNNVLIDNLLLDKPKLRTLGNVWGKLYLRKILSDNKIYFSEKLKMGEDYLFNFDFFNYVKEAKYIPNYVYHYRNDNVDSATRTYDEKLIEKYNNLFSTFESKYSERLKTTLKKQYDVFVIRQLDYFCKINIYGKNNGLDAYKRIIKLKELSEIEPYKTAIKEVSLNLLNERKMLLVILIRLKMYKTLDWILDKKRG